MERCSSDLVDQEDLEPAPPTLSAIYTIEFSGEFDGCLNCFVFIDFK